MDVVACSACALLVGCRRLRVRCDGCDVDLCGYCAELVGIEDIVDPHLAHPVHGHGDAIRGLGMGANVLPQPIPPHLLETLLAAQRSGLVVPSRIPLSNKNGVLQMAGAGATPELTCTVWCGSCRLESSLSRSQSPKVDVKHCGQCGSKVAGFGSFNNKRRSCVGCGVVVCSKNCSRSVLRPGKGIVVLCTNCIVSGV
jgi:hypothetical protein